MTVLFFLWGQSLFQLRVVGEVLQLQCMYTVSSEWIKLSKLAASTEKSKAASELIGRWEGQQIQTIMYGNMELILALVLNTLKDFDPDELFFRLHIRALP